ncbi:glycosyltransferase family 2 protein [Hafnia alvei]|uniref:Glycosyltransferase family 2 n=1 Tax=Hafnia alvei TaxID=569 RepID=A0A172X0K9_HAFAL|nr:glycosyltransferase family 2 protein [Hafnia alvei]ANF30170.1 glycosyltransferase family 2 [Hafnia alvei]TBM13619.1 glycosyltransferase family 2 protein [Hafnia alvei]
MTKIAAIIVLFNPKFEHVYSLVASLSTSCDCIILVDNSENRESKNQKEKYNCLDKVTYLSLEENKGIALAQNYGFIKAIELGANYFFTFDQDSTIDYSYVNDMLKAMNDAQSYSSRIAILGPTIVNERNGKAYNREIKKGRLICDGLIDVESVISSGALITLEALIYLGMNKSSWFIDLIDIEWCYRARHEGWYVLSTTEVKMMHNIGLNDINILGLKTFTLCSPFRLYFVYRNWLLAMREPSFPLRYKIKRMFVMPMRFLVYAFSDNRLLRIKYMIEGIRDGFIGRSGPYKRK